MIIARPPSKKQDCNQNRNDLTRLHTLDDLNSRPPRDKESARQAEYYRALPPHLKKGGKGGNWVTAKYYYTRKMV